MRPAIALSAALLMMQFGIRPAAAAEADCIAARDHRASFKAILDPDPRGKLQFETVDRRAGDGTIAIVRWVDGQKRSARQSLHGAFTKLLESTFGSGRTEIAFSPSIDLAKLFPLQPHATIDYRVSIGRADRFDPKFADVKVAIGAERDMDGLGCKLKVIDIVIDWRGTEPDAPVSKTTLTYAPALEYAVESKAQITLRERSVTNGTKVRSLEVWKFD